MKGTNNLSPLNTKSPIEESDNENTLEITQDTEFKRTLIIMIKQFNKFKEYRILSKPQR